jgi:hypothetical protein
MERMIAMTSQRGKISLGQISSRQQPFHNFVLDTQREDARARNIISRRHLIPGRKRDHRWYL